MKKFRHLIWMLVATSGLVLSVSQSQAQLRQPDVAPDRADDREPRGAVGGAEAERGGE